MEDLVQLAELLRSYNAISRQIAALIGRPAQQGHIGEWIAARLFAIRLDVSASRKAIDGHFMQGALADRTVNVKWYAKQEGLLDITPQGLPDYYLIMTGPRTAAASSRGAMRPLLIEHVYLFDAPVLVERLFARGVKVGVATSVRQGLWDAAELYPHPRCRDLVLSDDQRSVLMLFGSSAYGSW